MKKSISVKVLMPVVLLAIVALISALGGLLNTRAMLRQNEQMSQNTVSQLIIMNEISSDFKDINTLAFSMCVSTSQVDRQKMLLEAEELRADIADAIARYEQTVTTEEEAACYKALNEKYAEYGAAYDEVVSYISRGSKDKARQVCNEQLTDCSDNMDFVLSEMEAYMQTEVNEVTARQRTLGGIMQTVSLGAVIMIALLLVFAVVCSQRAVSPIKQATVQLEKIITEIQSGNGDLTKRIHVKSEDEVGKLAGGINVFLETLQRIMGQIVVDSKEMGEVVSSVVGSVGIANDSACDISALMQNEYAEQVRFFSGQLNISGSRAAEQIISVNAGRRIVLYEQAHPFRDILTQAVHIFTVAVNRLYGTAEPVCDVFHQNLFHSAASSDRKGGVNNHFLCDSLFRHLIPPKYNQFI